MQREDKKNSKACTDVANPSLSMWLQCMYTGILVPDMLVTLDMLVEIFAGT